MTLRASTVARIMAVAIVFLVIASTGIRVLAAVSGHGTMYGLVRFFTLDAENNLPTWYSAATLLFSAFVLALLASAEQRNGVWGRYWFGLAAIFVFLSMDEVGSFHEIFVAPVRNLLSTDGLLYFAWVVPGSILVLLLAVLYARWFFQLPSRTRFLMLISGVLFLGGALGLEMFGGLLTSRGQARSPAYIAIATSEEAAELAGVLVWIYSLLDYGAMRGYTCTVTFSGAASMRSSKSVHTGFSQ